MAATRIKYVGPHLAVELTRPDGTDVLVEHDEVLETSSEHAASLLEQESNWQPVPKAAAKSAKAEKGEVS